MSFPQFPDKNRRFNPAAPLRNKRRELFCRLYASDFWGRPEEALKAANYHVQGESAARKTAGMILDSEEVRERIAYLRKIKSENSVADDAWIKESLIKIIEHAKKDSDRIRALSNLKKLLVSTSSSAPGASGRRSRNEISISMEQAVFPFFEGGEDGAEDYPDPSLPPSSQISPQTSSPPAFPSGGSSS